MRIAGANISIKLTTIMESKPKTLTLLIPSFKRMLKGAQSEQVAKLLIANYLQIY
jgi:hypothetical protein